MRISESYGDVDGHAHFQMCGKWVMSQRFPRTLDKSTGTPRTFENARVRLRDSKVRKYVGLTRVFFMRVTSPYLCTKFVPTIIFKKSKTIFKFLKQYSNCVLRRYHITTRQLEHGFFEEYGRQR